MPSREIANHGNASANNSLKASRYKPEIDGLRAFAVVAVIINHFNKDILPGGYLGVDIFFVISGYVITSSLLGRPSKDFKDFISAFYERRIKRLVPALSVFVLITSIAICLFNPEPEETLRTGLTSLFGLSNLFLLKNSTDYFAQSTELNVFTHTWSLGVEEQFYILFPFLIWFSGFGRQTKNGARNLFLIVGALTIASLIGFLYLYPTNQPAAYFLMPSRFWEMATGCLIFIGFQKRASIEQTLEKVPPLLVVALIVGVMYLPMSLAAASTIAVVALSSILIASLKKQTAAFEVFTNPKVIYIGLISYSLYLWHWGVLSLSRWTIGLHWWSIPFQVALMLSLAVASYRYIETPLRKGNWFGRRWKTLLVGGGVLGVLSGGLDALHKHFDEHLFIGDNYHQWNMHIFENAYVYNHSDLPNLYLIGDSYSGHYGAVMINLAKEKLFNLTMHSRGSGLKLKSPDASKRANSEFILAPLRKYNSVFDAGDIVVFSATIAKYNKRNNWLKLYKTFLDQTKGKGLKYFLISPTPRLKVLNKFPQHGTRCNAEIYRPRWSIPSECFARIVKSEFLHENEHIYSDLNVFLLENPEVTYIDTFNAICPGSICYNSEDGIFLYQDGRHLSSYGSMKTKNAIKKAFNDAG